MVSRTIRVNQAPQKARVAAIFIIYLMSSLLAGTSFLFGAELDGLNLVSAPPTSEGDRKSSEDDKSEKHWLIIDGTRNQGYALTELLLKKNQPCTIFTSPEKRDEVIPFFGHDENLTITTGDITKDVTKLYEAALNATHLYFAPEFDGYSSWHEKISSALATCLAIAHQRRLHFVYPAARTYVFDGHALDANRSLTISTDLPFLPESKQGQTFMALEEEIKRHAYQHKLPITIIRTAHPFGSNMKEYLTYSSFHDAYHTKTFLWLYRDDLPYEYCYTGDIARLAEIATDEPPNELVTTLHLAGYRYNTALDFGHDIIREAHKDKNEYARQRLIGSWILGAISLGKPDAKRGIDIRRNFENSFLLDDTETYIRYPEFSLTPKEEAIRATLTWHRTFTIS